MTITIKALWAFALSLYARPGAEKACLEAQDRYGADVGLMLMLAWLDREGLAPDEDGWQALLAASATWQRETLAPIRARRRAAKGTPDYEALKAEELEAERKAMIELFSTVEPCLGKSGGGLLNRYGRETGIPASFTGILEAA